MPKSGKNRLRYILSYWGLEILTVFMAFCLLAAIITLLAYYDGHYMPEWPFQINLNSAIALLSTFLRAAIVAAVAEIIGQIKWTWFAEQSRPLQHLQDFDGASRSVLGSMHLLGVLFWNLGFTSAGFLAISAALVTVASLAVGPVTQQAVRTSPCTMLQDHMHSILPAAHYVPGSSSYYRVGAGMYELEVDMKSAMINGMTDPGSKDNDVTVVCPSGNCTWPDWGTGVTHASIGMCSSCLDTTKFVSPPQLDGNLTLPDKGSYINILGGDYMWMGTSNLSAYTELFTEDFAAAASVSMFNFSMLMVTRTPCTSDNSTGILKLHCPHHMSPTDDSYFDEVGDYIAASCILYPCLKEYYGEYLGNVLRERLVRTTTAVVNEAEGASRKGVGPYSGYGNYTAIQSPCVLEDGTWYDINNQSEAEHIPGRIWTNISLPGSGGKVTSLPNACLYKMDGIFAQAITYFLSKDLLSANCRYDPMQSGHLNCFNSWWLTPLWADMNATVSSVTEVIDKFAWAVTNKFRMTGFGPDALDTAGALNSRGAQVFGDVLLLTTCTYFDRKYIVLPIILVVICAALLGWVIFMNYSDPEQPVWKGSVLPLLFFGLQNNIDPRTQVPGTAPGATSAGGARGNGGGGSEEDERLARNMTFFKKNRRRAPELNRIHQESGRLWVRFQGGTDPGFLDLGTKGRDPEADSAGLVSGSRTGRNVTGSTTAR
ncbi:hypothetical protein LY78DRAFT_663757 [Colletotrichum sublineola]|nr:hypothetical protein LY78DRAFT_663757 [Colletotrichum sublineola]